MPTDPLVRYLEKPSRRRFAQLVKATRQDVLNASYRVLGDRQLAEDTTQDVYLKLLTVKWKTENIRCGRGLLVSTAILMARSKLRSESRRRHRESVVRNERHPWIDPASPELFWDVRDAVLSLPESLRACVELRYFGGLALEEVSRALDIPKRTLNARLRQARDLLREKLSSAGVSCLLPILTGESTESLPSLELSSDLAERLDRIAREGPSMAAVAAGSAVPGAAKFLWIAAAGLALSSAALLGFLEFLGRPDSAGSESERVVDGRDLPPPSRDVDSGARPAAAVRSGASASAPDTVSIEPEGRRTVAVSPTGVSIRVLTPQGTLLRQGELHLSLPLDSLFSLSELSPEKALEIAPYRTLVEEPIDLAIYNPLELNDIPDELAGLDFSCHATAPRYAPSDELKIQLKPGTMSDSVLKVLETRELAVTVTGEEEQPVPGAAVVSATEIGRRRLEFRELRGSTGPGAAVTDAEGRTVLAGLSPGPHDVEIYAEGYRTARVRLDEAEREWTVRLERLSGTGTVIARVLGYRGEPVDGVRVELEVEGESAERTGETGDDGRFKFADVPSGKGHKLSVAGRAWWELRRQTFREFGSAATERLRGRWPFDLGAQESREVQIGFFQGTASLIGRVVGPRGEPRQGVKVRVYGSGAHAGVMTRSSDSRGYVAFERLPADRYRSTAGDWTFPEFELGEGVTWREQWTLGSLVLRGRVVSAESGEPVEGISVHLTQRRAHEITETDESGRFELSGASPGACEVSPFSFEHLSYRRQLDLPAEGAPEIELVIRRGSRIRVEFENPDGVAVDRIDVRFARLDGEAEATLRRFDAGPGEYFWRTVAIHPGRYVVRLRTPNAEPLVWTVEVGENETATVRF